MTVSQSSRISIQIERIHLATLAKQMRSVAMVGVAAECGVSEIARLLALREKRRGSRVLVVVTRSDQHSSSSWLPGDGRALSDAAKDACGLDVLMVAPTAEMLDRHNDAASIRATIKEALLTYDSVVFDLPPMDRSRRNELDPAIVASACDAVVVVALTGETTPAALASCAASLRETGAKILGLVANDAYAPPLKEDIGREFHRLANACMRILRMNSQRRVAPHMFRNRQVGQVE